MQEGSIIKPVPNVWAELPGSSMGARWRDILVPNKWRWLLSVGFCRIYLDSVTVVHP